MSSGGRPVRSRPPTVTVPADILITPTRLLSKVLLPDPLAPTSDTTWPASTPTLMSRITGSPPYPAVTPVPRSAGPPVSATPVLPDKVRLHDLGAPAQFRHGSHREHRALRHRYHGITELVHDRQLVLHHEHGEPAGGKGGELVADPPGQVGVHAGHRLPEQQHPPVGHERAHDFHEPPLPAAQVPGVAVGVPGEAEPFEQRARPL